MNKYCLITGAASGIGYEFAKLFLKDSHNLVLIDKNYEKLHEIKQDFNAHYQSDVVIMSFDLSQPDIAKIIYEEIIKLHIQIDVLINNAGFGIHGYFYSINWKNQFDLIQLTVVTNTHLTKLFLADMLERNSGKILNVSSIAAFQPGPLMSVYYATKSYLLSFSLAIADELKGTNVTVTALCPGMTKTSFQKTNGNENPKYGILCSSASNVAKIGYRALKKGKSVVIPCLYNRVIANIHRFVPLTIATKLSRALQEKNRNSQKLSNEKIDIRTNTYYVISQYLTFMKTNIIAAILLLKIKNNGPKQI